MKWILALTLVMTVCGLAACSDDDGTKKDGAVADARVDGLSRDLQPSHEALPKDVSQPPGDAFGDGLTPTPDGPPRDLLITGDALAFPLCAAAGGGCTIERWDICPAGFAPATPNASLDCGNGYCCVPAPTSTCTQDPGTNCLPGKQCPGCWGAPTDTTLTCPSDQVCCAYICD